MVLNLNTTRLLKNRLSNMDIPGQWIFRVGPLDSEDNVEEPDINNRGSYIIFHI